jgi:hypothetical protein
MGYAVAGSSAPANSGNGGYGGYENSLSGGSGIIILRYPSGYIITNPGGGLTFSTATVGTDKVTTFTAGTGNIQFA